MGIYIGSQNLKPNAVTTEKIVDGTITEADLDASLQAKVNAAAAPLDGTGTSGTWPISVTGNAATASVASGLNVSGHTVIWDGTGSQWWTSEPVTVDNSLTVNGDIHGNLAGNADTATSATTATTATTATRATNLGSTALGLVKVGTGGAPASATGADVAALITSTNIVTSGTVTSPSVWPEANPASHGYLAWSFPIAGAAGTPQTPVAQRLYLQKIWLPSPVAYSITGVAMYRAVALVSAADTNAVAVYKSDGTQLGKSASTATAWATGTNHEERVALNGGPFTITGGAGVYVLVAFLSSASTMPTFMGVTMAHSVYPNLGLTGLGYYASVITGQTTIPNSVAAGDLIAAATEYWVALY